MWEMKADLLLENKEALELLKNVMGIGSYMENIAPGMYVAAYDFFSWEKSDLNFKSPNDSSRYIT